MINLVIHNSICRIERLDPQQFSELREILSYEVDKASHYFSGSFRSPKRYLLDKKGVFPSGLLYAVENWLEEKGLGYSRHDARKRPNGLEKLFTMSLDLAPYPEQFDAALACINAHRGIVSAVTAFGKSAIMALVVHNLQFRTLIIVPNIELKRQLISNFTRWFGDLSNITIKNVDDPSLETDGNYDVLIIDEAHHVAAATYRRLNLKVWNNIYYRFFFTATPFRSKDEEQLLFESIAGEVIYRIDYSKAVKLGYVAPVEAYYVEVPKSVMEGNTASWAAVYNELVVNNERRNEIVSTLIQNFTDMGRAVLCLVKEVKHGALLAKTSEVEFVHGENPFNRERILEFNLREQTSLVGTNGILGEGVDTKPAEFIIIAGLGKSKNQFMQQVGRGLRKYKNKESCKVVIFLDKSHKFTIRHFKAQVKYLKEEYNVIPKRLEI